MICFHVNRKAHVACNLNYLFENEGLLKVTDSHVHRKSGNISEKVPGAVIYGLLNTDNFMTRSDLRHHSLTASLFKCDVCTAAHAEKVSSRFAESVLPNPMSPNPVSPNAV